MKPRQLELVLTDPAKWAFCKQWKARVGSGGVCASVWSPMQWVLGEW